MESFRYRVQGGKASEGPIFEEVRGPKRRSCARNSRSYIKLDIISLAVFVKALRLPAYLVLMI